jgi:hypothetical protein
VLISPGWSSDTFYLHDAANRALSQYKWAGEARSCWLLEFAYVIFAYFICFVIVATESSVPMLDLFTANSGSRSGRVTLIAWIRLKSASLRRFRPQMRLIIGVGFGDERELPIGPIRGGLAGVYPAGNLGGFFAFSAR